MKRISIKCWLFAALFLGSIPSLFAQVEIDRNVIMNGAADADRRVTGLANAFDVTPDFSDATNIRTIQRNYLTYAASTFAGNVYTVNLVPAIPEYWTGMIVSFRAAAANTASASINVNGQGNRVIRKAGGQELAAGDIQANQMVTAIYNGTSFELVGSLGNPAWYTRGNTGINATNDFLGTINNATLNIRTNNTLRMSVSNEGIVTINPNDTGLSAPFRTFSNHASVAGWVRNANTEGTGLIATGNNAPSLYLVDGSGVAANGTRFGVTARAHGATNGWGVAAAGNDLGISTLNNEGGGGAFSGTRWGVFGNATISGNNNVNRAAFVGNFYSAGNTQRTVYVGARIGGTHYKILDTGDGSVSATMSTRDGDRILFAPESPENWFFDIGEVTLVNGKARVELDPLFYDCISKDKPFKVFVQGAENTIGAIRVKARGDDWFELEDTGGSSSGTVLFSIYAIWKGKENLRLPKYEGNIHPVEHPAQVIDARP
jgi:hypothetical protein